MSSINLVGVRKVGGNRIATIKGDYGFIQSKLGKPNVTDMDDADKVKASWGMKDENTEREIFVWCYKVSTGNCQKWSASGDISLLTEIFGEHLLIG